MREQILALLRLQEVDSKLVDVEAAFREIPGKIEELNREIERFEKMLEEERAHLQEAVEYQRRQEGYLKEDEERIARAKQQLQNIRNAREYAAAQRELEGFKKAKMDREEELLRLMEAVEASRTRLEQHEQEFAELKGHLEGQRAELEAELEEARKKRDAMAGERAAAQASIRPEVLAKYEAIAKRVHPAVVPARNAVCMGCNMNIPPQLYNVLFRVDSLEVCPFCQRIIYLESAVVEHDSDDADGSPRPDGDETGD